MTGQRVILATMALVVFVSSSLGAVQRFENPHTRISSTCSATEGKQSAHADTNRVAVVIGNINYPDADARWHKSATTPVHWRARFVRTVSTLTSFKTQSATTCNVQSGA